MNVMKRAEKMVSSGCLSHTEKPLMHRHIRWSNWFQPNYSECRICIISYGIFNLSDTHSIYWLSCDGESTFGIDNDASTAAAAAAFDHLHKLLNAWINGTGTL